MSHEHTPPDETTHEGSYDHLMDPNYPMEANTVEGAAVRPPVDEEAVQLRTNRMRDRLVWDANIDSHRRRTGGTPEIKYD